MYCRRPYNWFTVVFAAIVGIAVAAILYYVESAAISTLLWIGLGLGVLLLIVLLYIVTRTGNPAPTFIARCLFDDGNFLAVSIIGTILTSGISLSLQALLAASATPLPVLILVFLFGFFFGGMFAALLHTLLCVLAAPSTPNPGGNPVSPGPISYRP